MASSSGAVNRPAHNAPPYKMMAANSNNHRNRGQNVLYGDGHVQWQFSVYCGMPRALNATFVAKRVFDGRGLLPLVQE